MPYIKKNGEVVHSSRTIIDDLTFRPLSRQRKYQLRKRKEGCCTKCGTPVELENRIRKNQLITVYPELCAVCKQKVKEIRKGNLQGRKEGLKEDDTPLEGFCD